MHVVALILKALLAAVYLVAGIFLVDQAGFRTTLNFWLRGMLFGAGVVLVWTFMFTAIGIAWNAL